MAKVALGRDGYEHEKRRIQNEAARRERAAAARDMRKVEAELVTKNAPSDLYGQGAGAALAMLRAMARGRVALSQKRKGGRGRK